MVAKVTEMNTRDALLRFMSSAVPRAVGTTAERLVRIRGSLEKTSELKSTLKPLGKRDPHLS
jgi:hypothetical protein